MDPNSNTSNNYNNRNRNTNNNRNLRSAINNAVNFATELHSILSNYNLPNNYTIRPLPTDRNDYDARHIFIDVVNNNSIHTGQIILYKPEEGERGYVTIMSSIASYSGYFNLITVDTFAEMITVIMFTQRILQFQPNNNRLEYVHIPYNMLNHWCVSPMLRNANLRHLYRDHLRRSDPQVS